MKGVNLSAGSDKPIYQQLFEQLSSQILKGELESGFNLPSIRTAARELRISIITVKKAWEELERAGLIYTAAGKGCFVSDLSYTNLTRKKDEILREQISKDLLFYRGLGVTREEILELVGKFYDLPEGE